MGNRHRVRIKSNDTDDVTIWAFVESHHKLDVVIKEVFVLLEACVTWRRLESNCRYSDVQSTTADGLRTRTHDPVPG